MRFEEIDARLQALCERALAGYRRAFGEGPTWLVAAPGRVNLIGEHTDYNDGFVLPAAIDRHVVLAVGPRVDRQVRLAALDLKQQAEFSLDALGRDDARAWSNYQRGVAWALQEEGLTLAGIDVALTSDVPIASGLSSSAALEVATAHAFEQASGFTLEGVRRALLCQKAENDFVGMRCGIMDQYIISVGRRDHALLIDCRSLASQAVPVPEVCSIVVCDTGKRRGLVDSEYNARRRECEEGAQALGVPALRDATSEMLASAGDALPEVTRRRCRHVISENERVTEAVAALNAGDLERMGRLMAASHASLRDDYEVSCAELDAMVEAATRCEGVYGARMTGAGFGGCTVNLVAREAVPEFTRRVPEAYRRAAGLEPRVYVCRAEEGVRTLPLG